MKEKMKVERPGMTIQDAVASVPSKMEGGSVCALSSPLSSRIPPSHWISSSKTVTQRALWVKKDRDSVLLRYPFSVSKAFSSKDN